MIAKSSGLWCKLVVIEAGRDTMGFKAWFLMLLIKVEFRECVIFNGVSIV